MRASSRTATVWLLAALSFAAYASAFDNGFIADDYPNLESARQFREDPGYLYSIPPQNFRMTTFAFFAVADALFGDRAAFYYAFPLLVHFVNCLLLWRLLVLLGRGASEARLAAALFAVFQAPQEAIMWLSASAEAMQGLCVLGVLILWIRKRYVAAGLVYCIALFTKESAPVVLLLVALIDWLRGERRLRPYLLFVPPTLGFAILFLALRAQNPMIQLGLYELGPHAILVLLQSLHRLIWPWAYILIAAHRWISGRWFSWLELTGTLAFLASAMLPYIFVTYTTSLPSRHVYLASLGLTGAFAYALTRIPNSRFRHVFVGVFIVFNVVYLWGRKDSQFEERAAPTTALLEVLKERQPAPIMIYDFAYPYPIIAKSVSQFVPGSSHELIKVDGTDAPCGDCLGIRWDPSTQRYTELE